MWSKRFAILFPVSFAFAVPATAQQGEGETAVGVRAELVIETTDNYPLDTCVVCDKALGERPAVLELEGRKWKTCCAACKSAIEKDVKPSFAKLRDAAVAAQGPGYPGIKTRDPRYSRCILCRAELAKAEAPVVHLTRDNLMVIVCSEACAAGFDEHRSARQRHAVNLRGLLSTRTSTATEKSCCVCEKENGAEAAWVQHGTTLLKACGKECVKAFRATPNAFVARAAAKAAAARAEASKTETETGGKGADSGKTDKPIKK